MKDLTTSIYTFENLIKGGYQYVDKTNYIWELVRPEGESYFLSRPRRFGKSLTVSTLKAVFRRKERSFQGTGHILIHDGNTVVDESSMSVSNPNWFPCVGMALYC